MIVLSLTTSNTLKVMGCMPSRKISAAERLTGHSFISFTQDILKADSCMVKLSDDEIELKTWIPDTLRGRGKIKKPI